jgi:predicted SnoaL-like aldol condensation-catalyzing enzyme
MRRSLGLTGPLTALALFANQALAESTAAIENNKQTVLEFYNKGVNQKDFTVASAYLDPAFKHHNPARSGGIEGFKAFLSSLREKHPNAHFEIKRVFADGDYVITHVHAMLDPGAKGTAVVDIYKLGNGRILEHWDVRQDIPDNAANLDGLF